MDIVKLSASAMEVAELCLSRWDADNKAGRIGQESGHYAKVGSACHGAMEQYVRKAVMSTEMDRTWRTLEVLYMQSYMEVFGTLDTDAESYKDGLTLIKKWFERTIFDDSFTVLMVEEKLNFQVPTGELLPDGTKETIPFNFIFDRFDQTGETEYRVVDYKTLSQPLSPMDLHDKIQPRVYGLAAQILHPDATKVWVGFDMLRWEGSIETFYTREDNIATWNRIKRAVRKIKECDPNDIPETLNSNCGWCIKKTTCKAVAANVKAGGVFSLDEQGMIDARALLKMQAKAASDAVTELDKIILANMQARDLTQIETNLITAKAVVRGTRSIDPERVRQIAGQDLFEKYGSVKIGMKDLDALLSDPALDPNARARLESCITKEYGAPYLATSERKRK